MRPTPTPSRWPVSSTPGTNAPDPSGRFLCPCWQPSWHTDPLTVLGYLNRGAGGWGNPFTRNPERLIVDATAAARLRASSEAT